MKWIKVEDRLPEPGERVLFSVNGFVGEGYISEYKIWYRLNHSNHIEDVLGKVEAWCKMPKPYMNKED